MDVALLFRRTKTEQKLKKINQGKKLFCFFFKSYNKTRRKKGELEENLKNQGGRKMSVYDHMDKEEKKAFDHDLNVTMTIAMSIFLGLFVLMFFLR